MPACLVDLSPTSSPWLFNANRGTIILSIDCSKGSILIEPDSKVLTSDGKPVNAQCTTTSLSFTAEVGNTYSVHIIQLADTDAAEGAIVEACTPKQTLAKVYGTTHWTTLSFRIVDGADKSASAKGGQ